MNELILTTRGDKIPLIDGKCYCPLSPKDKEKDKPAQCKTCGGIRP